MNWHRDFDWAGAIDLNREALKGIIAHLFVLLGLDGPETLGRIPYRLHRAVLRVLRPAESAVRRLIIVAARGLVVKLASSCPMPRGHRTGKASGASRPAFKLCDKRIFFPELSMCLRRPPVMAPAPPRDGLINAKRLAQRLQALRLALEDLPRQARRMARWRVRREAETAPKFIYPLRPGKPPGHRRKLTHEVDHVLKECHGLAWEAMRLKPDSS